jgi:HEAT repeat protein
MQRIRPPTAAAIQEVEEEGRPMQRAKSTSYKTSGTTVFAVGMVAGAAAVLGSAFLWCNSPARSQAATADAVEEVRKALKAPSHEPAAREASLRKRVEALQTINELRRALLLPEWRDEDPEEAIAAVDQPLRSAVARRFAQAVRGVLERGDSTGQLAVLHVLAEMGPRVRDVGARTAFTRGFSADVARMTRHEDPRVREAAARALGWMLPGPEEACPALAVLLRAKDASERLAAADGLLNLLRVTAQLATRSRGTTGPEASRADAIAVACAVVPVAASALADEHAGVRRLCVDAIGVAAATLSKLVPEPRQTEDAADMQEYRRGLEEDVISLAPLFQVLKEQVPALTRALGDSHAEVRLMARGALEEADVADARLRVIRQAMQLEAAGDDGSNRSVQPAGLPAPGAQAEGLQTKIAALVAGMSDKDARARRAAIDVLEALGVAAAPAAPALVKALTDSDRFVRWSAARTLGKVAPAEERTAVPAVGRLLEDDDPDVRLAAITALERYGPASASEVPALLRNVPVGDTEVRLAAMRALKAIGSDAQAAIPILTAALADGNARIRQTAAECLGSFGPAAQDGAEDLRRLLADRDPGVRKAASAALLAIMETAKK